MEKQETTKGNKRNRCIKCNSTFGYLKIKVNSWQCRSCGYLDKNWNSEENSEEKSSEVSA